MATYQQIQVWVKKEFDFIPKSCWIAHAKELFGLPVRRAHNRRGRTRQEPCPISKFSAIKGAFFHFRMIKEGERPKKPIGPMPVLTPPKGQEGWQPGVDLNNTAAVMDLTEKNSSEPE